MTTQLQNSAEYADPLQPVNSTTGSGKALGSPAKSLIGFLLYFSLCVAMIALLVKTGMIRWPFRRGPEITDTYQNIIIYLPVLLLGMGSLFFTKPAGIPLRHLLICRHYSIPFFAGALFSIGYSVWVFAACRFPMEGYAYWPLIVVLSIMNAATEEIVYRLVFYSLVKSVINHPLSANIIQSTLYASVHIPITGLTFSGLVFLYGLFLGHLLETHKSIIPGTICHFLIDIGVIGLPLLVILPMN